MTAEDEVLWFGAAEGDPAADPPDGAPPAGPRRRWGLLLASALVVLVAVEYGPHTPRRQPAPAEPAPPVAQGAVLALTRAPVHAERVVPGPGDATRGQLVVSVDLQAAAGPPVSLVAASGELAGTQLVEATAGGVDLTTAPLGSTTSVALAAGRDTRLQLRFTTDLTGCWSESSGPSATVYVRRGSSTWGVFAPIDLPGVSRLFATATGCRRGDPPTPLGRTPVHALQHGTGNADLGQVVVDAYLTLGVSCRGGPDVALALGLPGPLVRVRCTGLPQRLTHVPRREFLAELHVLAPRGVRWALAAWR